MSDTVFILGAGASKEGGAPLMADFLDRATDLWSIGDTNGKEQHFERVFRAIRVLQTVHSKARLDLNNIESVFAAFEMATTLQQFADYSPEQLQQLATDTTALIATTLDRTLRYALPPRPRRFGAQVSPPEPLEADELVAALQPPEPYASFANLLGRIQEDPRLGDSVALITFNYDLALEVALFRADRCPYYALEDEEFPVKAVPLLKLHGSLNWCSCASCQSTIAVPITHDGIKKCASQVDQRTALLSSSSLLQNYAHCGNRVASDPLLVPPTWNKTKYYEELDSVWARAAQELFEAQRIVVIGYSLPDSDIFFRYLYALGTAGGPPLRRFLVFNPDEGLERRFRGLLGVAAAARFEYHSKTFKQALEHLERLVIIKEF